MNRNYVHLRRGNLFPLMMVALTQQVSGLDDSQGKNNMGKIGNTGGYSIRITTGTP